MNLQAETRAVEGDGNEQLAVALDAQAGWLTEYAPDAEYFGVPRPAPVRHKAIVVKVPQDASGTEWLRAADYAYGRRHTMTASHDDMLAVLRGGNTDSCVMLAWPERQQDTIRLIEDAGYAWIPLFDDPLELQFWPVKGNPVVTQRFGVNPQDYAPFGLPGHEGIDMKAALNTPIVAAAAGTVIERATGSLYGKYIRLAHPNGWKTVYAHLNAFSYDDVGDVVAAGQAIGFAGMTGNSTGVHLHFGVSHETKQYTDAMGNRWPKNIHDPTPYLQKWLLDASPGAETIDLLPYLCGDGRIYRMTVVLDGHRHGQQVQTQREIDRFYLVKNREWEELFADEETIYRGIDTSPGNGLYYRQRQDWSSDRAAWCPRHWSVGAVYERNPLVTFHRKETGNEVSDPAPGYRRTWLLFAARHGLWSLENSLALLDVIELRWLPRLDGPVAETYFYARGFGLVGWRSSSGSYSYADELSNAGEVEPLEREKIVLR